MPLPITQGQLAELASASRSSVARALAALRNAGVLRTGPKQIVLADLDELAAAVSFDTATPGEFRRTGPVPAPMVVPMNADVRSVRAGVPAE